MLLNHRRLRVLLYRRPIDMRAGFERLAHFVRAELKGDLLEGHLYLFLGKNRRRAKVLFFDGTGLVLLHKRLEVGRFMRIEETCDHPEMTTAELSLLLDGTQLRFPLAPSSFVKKSEEKSDEKNVSKIFSS